MLGLQGNIGVCRERKPKNQENTTTGVKVGVTLLNNAKMC